MPELHERVARLEEQMHSVNARFDELDREGTDRSRRRLHDLEQDIAARKAAEAAVSALRSNLNAGRSARWARIGIAASILGIATNLVIDHVF